MDVAVRYRTYATEHVRAVRRLVGIELDYSPASLEICDRLIDEGWADHTPGKVDAVVNLFGAYLGEVIIRNLGGQWAVDDKFGICVAGIGRIGGRALPLVHAGRRFLQGRQASLSAYYESLAALLERLGG
ncbi:MAG: DUF6278 family protein [Armatimonadota bacterium]|nr:DUF6278 family protein [Armatimonadota bacterium]MDR5696391.1 DUF6278 family protein [Armatimonadota bacterium]